MPRGTSADWDVLLVSVVLLGVAVVAAWFALSRRGGPSWFALAVGVGALVVFASWWLASESLRVLAVGLGLAAIWRWQPARVASEAQHDAPASRQRRGRSTRS